MTPENESPIDQSDSSKPTSRNPKPFNILDLIDDPAGFEEWTGSAVGGMSAADCDALIQEFRMPDVVGQTRQAISNIFSVYTLDFEVQYQQGYGVLNWADQTLLEQRNRSRAPKFAPVAHSLDQMISDQEKAVRELRATHVDHHRRYREAMQTVLPQMQRDAVRAAEERASVVADTNADLLRTQAQINEKARHAADRRHEIWMENNRSW